MAHALAPSPLTPLLQSEIFKPYPQSLPVAQQAQASYLRARAIAKKYGLSIDDVATLSDKFWDMHLDGIHTLDLAPLSLLTIQYNLSAGTIAPHLKERPDLLPLMHAIMNFDICAQFLLTEVAHGLDAKNLETTATLLPDGGFDLHTPHDGAAKFMPPTGPVGGIPKMALVYARLIVKGEDRGLRIFLVSLNNGYSMCKGVTALSLPKRAGAKLVDHAVTYFDHVHLPRAAMLGSLDKPVDERANFLSSIWRVSVGSLALSTSPIGALATAAVIAARYSLRRTVTGDRGDMIPIWSFRTQQLPILHAIAKVYVMKAHAKDAIRIFKDTKLDYRVRMGVAASFKIVTVPHTQSSLTTLSERMGAQGLFEHNLIISTQLETKGISIAEGDVLALSIRLASEILLGRYEMPKPRFPECLLARHEMGLIAEYKELLSRLSSHRGEEFNRIILPLCPTLVEAIGCRMAYEAAFDAGVPRALLGLYEAGVLKQDAAWYSEHAQINRWMQHEMEENAASAALPHLEEYLAGLNVDEYAARAPITTQDGWDSFRETLEVSSGDSVFELFPDTHIVGNDMEIEDPSYSSSSPLVMAARL